MQRQRAVEPIVSSDPVLRLLQCCLLHQTAQMWQRGRAMSKRDWTLLRVAVVACVNDVYYGRLFFGDPDTQQVLWDTDVRPSDATFLALKVCWWCTAKQAV